jgi:aminoglycoside 2'-N-acetyltransferase I
VSGRRGTDDAPGPRGPRDGLVAAHTSDLDPAVLAAARSLLDAVFGAEMTEEDWDHALGGVHALVWEQNELVGHASVVQRRLLHDGRALRTGYVEGVAVRADRRARGHAAAMMNVVERVVRAAYDVGALAATDAAAGLYAARGWRRWAGPTHALTPTGVIRTAGDDGGVYVLDVGPPLDRSRALTCDWRDGDLW